MQYDGKTELHEKQQNAICWCHGGNRKQWIRSYLCGSFDRPPPPPDALEESAFDRLLLVAVVPPWDFLLLVLLVALLVAPDDDFNDTETVDDRSTTMATSSCPEREEPPLEDAVASLPLDELEAMEQTEGDPSSFIWDVVSASWWAKKFPST